MAGRSNLDTAYFTGNSAPYTLSSGNDWVYVLTTDVIASGSFGGELFKLVGTNVELDPNGHVIIYNGKLMTQATESEFFPSEHVHRAKTGSPIDLHNTDVTVQTQAGTVERKPPFQFATQTN